MLHKKKNDNISLGNVIARNVRLMYSSHATFLPEIFLSLSLSLSSHIYVSYDKLRNILTTSTWSWGQVAFRITLLINNNERFKQCTSLYCCPFSTCIYVSTFKKKLMKTTIRIKRWIFCHFYLIYTKLNLLQITDQSL